MFSSKSKETRMSGNSEHEGELVKDETRDVGKGQHAGPFKGMVRNLDFLLSAMERRVFAQPAGSVVEH